MATVRMISDQEASEEVRAVFDDIRKVRNTDFINNFWRGLANDPVQLKAVWGEIKSVMGPGSLDPLVKEMIYIAVSAANSCSYCIHSHTAAAKAKGMSAEQHGELMRVIALAGKTNHAVNAMQLEIDEAFKV
ncbi:MAG: carboxymuconolactone decarboxylase family protein [Nitratireductor sp.]